MVTSSHRRRCTPPSPFLAGSVPAGLAIGGTFGLVRGAAVLAAAHVRELGQLRALHRGMQLLPRLPEGRQWRPWRCWPRSDRQPWHERRGMPLRTGASTWIFHQAGRVRPTGDRPAVTAGPILSCTPQLSASPGAGDCGSGAVELMTAGPGLVSLFEYGPEAVGTALFAKQGLPDVRPDRLQSPHDAAAASRARRIAVLLHLQRPGLLPLRGAGEPPDCGVAWFPVVNEVLRTLRIEAGG